MQRFRTFHYVYMRSQNEASTKMAQIAVPKLLNMSNPRTAAIRGVRRRTNPTHWRTVKAGCGPYETTGRSPSGLRNGERTPEPRRHDVRDP
jgi:hypothetical protein